VHDDVVAGSINTHPVTNVYQSTTVKPVTPTINPNITRTGINSKLPENEWTNSEVTKIGETQRFNHHRPVRHISE